MSSKSRQTTTFIAPNLGPGLMGLGSAASFVGESGLDLTTDATTQVHEGARTHVARILQLVQGHDPVELLAHLRINDIGNLLAGIPESERPADHSHAITELLALILLAGGFDQPADAQPGAAASVVEGIREHAAWIVRAAQFGAVSREIHAPDPIDRLVARHVAGHLATRGWQYTSIARDVNASFLEQERTSALLGSHLGFSPQEVQAVADAIVGLQNDRIEAAMERLRVAATAGRAPTEEERRQAATLFTHPQELLVLTAGDVAEEAGVPTDRTAAILDLFSVSAGGEDADGVARAFIEGSNPFHSRGLVRLDETRFLPLGTAMLPEAFRAVLESALPRDTPVWASYDKARASWTEREAVRQISRLLNVEGATHTGLRYLAPVAGVDDTELGPAAVPPADKVKQVEADAVFVVDGVAFCVEVKAGALSPRARSGHPRRLMKDLDALVRSANNQAARLRDLLLTNGGVWTAKRKWLSFESVHEVRSVVVTLDDCGPVLLSMPHLIETGLIATEQVPWVVSLHDLRVVADVLSWPAQFLCYVRRRTHPEAVRWLEAADELDILMAFVQGHLFFEGDPDAPTRLAGRTGDVGRRRRYRAQGPTLIGTLTDDLDDWYGSDDPSGRGPVKPERDEGGFVSWFLARTQREQMRGWLRVGAVLVGLSTAARQNLERQKTALVGRARARDASSVTYAGEDETIAWLIVMATRRATGAFEQYLAAKKYQLHADLAFGLVFDDTGAATGSVVLDSPWIPDPAADAEVDRLVAAGRLKEPERTPQAVPPSARRATKRLRGGRRRGKR